MVLGTVPNGWSSKVVVGKPVAAGRPSSVNDYRIFVNINGQNRLALEELAVALWVVRWCTIKIAAVNTMRPYRDVCVLCKVGGRRANTILWTIVSYSEMFYLSLA